MGQLKVPQAWVPGQTQRCNAKRGGLLAPDTCLVYTAPLSPFSHAVLPWWERLNQRSLESFSLGLGIYGLILASYNMVDNSKLRFKSQIC